MYKVLEGSKFKSLTIYKKPQITKGFSNVCEDGMGILVIDYDNVEESIVLEDYENLQTIFNLPRAYLFSTKKGNYHIICPYKAPQSKIFEILCYTRCDANFTSMPLRNPYRSYVLRLSSKKGSKKPKFVKIIGKEGYSSSSSSAHINLLKKLYPKIKHPKYDNLDHLKEIKFHTYETGA